MLGHEPHEPSHHPNKEQCIHMTNGTIEKHRIVSQDEWLEARKKLLEKEKQFTRLQDELNLERRSLPWVKVTKEYIFDGPSGKETLGDLFEGRSQLIVYHFMFAPESKAGCPHCSLRADGFNGINIHLMHRDVTMIAVSRAPYEKLAAYKQRMGWGFKWVSCGNTDFNFDFHFAFTPAELAAGKAYFNYTIQNPGPADREGHSVFYRDEHGDVFHTYSCYMRGNELFNIHYHYLDIVPKGRDENGRGPFWVRRHDEYISPSGS
jgi:predicted dithiol-disulfide oxidoreductase (DUF899 family)